MSNTSLLGSFGGQGDSSLMFRNVLINGCFRVWQRGTTGDSLQANGDAGTYAAVDRWKLGGSDGSTIFDIGRITQTSITTLPGFSFGAKLTTKFASAKSITLAQFVEAANVQHLAGTQCTFSFYARKLTSSTETSNMRVTVGALATTDTSGAITNSPTAFSDSLDSGNIPLSNISTSWQRYSYTFTLSANATKGICAKVNIYNAAGIGAYDLIEITGASLESGPTATPFERRPIGTELALCQRYYEKWEATQAYGRFGTGVTTATNLIHMFLPYRVEKRSNIITFLSSAYNTFSGVAAPSFLSIDSVSINGGDGASSAGVGVNFGISGGTVGLAYSIRSNNNTATFIAVSAEL